MNATLKRLRWFEQAGRTRPIDQANRAASRTASGQDHTPGSYGRGAYAGQTTYALDFRTPGSYGRGIYAGRSTADVDFGAQGSFAGGM